MELKELLLIKRVFNKELLNAISLKEYKLLIILYYIIYIKPLLALGNVLLNKGIKLKAFFFALPFILN
jgi:hypothetical protein